MPNQHTKYVVYVHGKSFPNKLAEQEFPSINLAKNYMRQDAKQVPGVQEMFLYSFDSRWTGDKYDRDEEELANYGLYSDGKWHWTYWSEKVSK